MTGASITARQMLGQAWQALDGPPEALELVEFSGDPIGLLPSRLAALPAVAAAVSASTLAASLLHAKAEGSTPAPVRIDFGEVAAAARSEVFAHRVGYEPPTMIDPLTSPFLQTTDGFLRLHTLYPWHRQRTLALLGCDDQLPAVAEAVRSWSKERLERELARAGTLGSAVRTHGEWLAHPQGQAVAALPLVTGEPGPGGRASPGPKDRHDPIRVLDLTRVIAGPVATRTLAAWGADVLRIESPGLPEIPALALDTLSGKRSALVDLSQPRGRAQLEELLSQADLIVQGYRPGAFARFGLGSESLADRHPHLSVITLSAWGQTGPWALRRGFDSMVQGASGIAMIEGSDERPGVLPVQVLDHATGYLAAAAAMLVLAGTLDGQPAEHLALSLAQTAHWLVAAGRFERQPERTHPHQEYLVSLPGVAGPVRVVRPPGQAGDRLPRWRSTTTCGADLPTFEP